MAGRGRNKPHMRKKEAPKEAIEREPGCQVDESESAGSPGAPADEDPSKMNDGPVPRVSMDYFYVSSQRGGPRKGAQGMSTKEIKRKLAEIGRSIEGPRNVLVKRYERFVEHEDREDTSEEEVQGPHAAESPMIVMVDEQTGNKYMRAVNHKGLGPDGDASWLVKDMHQELKSWGHPGGGVRTR